MKVLIVGGGAREHALAWKISQSPLLTELIAAPGNPGIGSLGRCVSVRANDIDGLVSLAVSEKVDLVVVGPEDPLAAGLVDRLEAAGICAFGPGRAAAQLEASKSFSKDLMLRHGIPTARYEVVTSNREALEALDRWSYPLAVKADGLAAGKGVTIAQDRSDAEQAIHRCMVDCIFGDVGRTVVLEEYLMGEEVSLIGLCDGKKVVPLEPAEDHKQVFDGDRGPNTGGMGCFSPVPALAPEAAADATRSVLQAVVDAMAAEGAPFRGALFAGLMLTDDGPKVLEFNARFGDPETEVILPRMKSDLLPFLVGCAQGSLPSTPILWSEQVCVCVVLASGGYPGTYETGKLIHGLDAITHQPGLDAGVQVFHAGTALNAGKLVTAGGRVLGVTALGDGIDDAIHKAYSAADSIHFAGVHRRNDIARRRQW